MTTFKLIFQTPFQLFDSCVFKILNIGKIPIENEMPCSAFLPSLSKTILVGPPLEICNK
jgi:hypothetical protein